MFKKFSWLCLVVMSLAFICPQADANPLRKLGRGVANIVCGPFELLLQPYDVNMEEGAVACYTYGIFKGIAYMLAREGVGVTELVTFPMPLPGMTDSPYEGGWGYGPMLQPEWVFDTEHNPYNLIYADLPAN